jgi:nitroimidazol reductase NimA-like FMN-containing flavoprotein (pyridoxamine 5'-phosphate oxidase superfamily)
MGAASNSIPSRRLVELSRAECLELLAQSSFGRVVLSSPSSSKPIIRPVNYRFDEHSKSVVFRSVEGSKFHALARSANALFEIDALDERGHTGWSVIISGATEQVTGPADIRRLEELGLALWAPGERPHWIRIRARTVSGRRIEPAGDGDAQ